MEFHIPKNSLYININIARSVQLASEMERKLPDQGSIPERSRETKMPLPLSSVGREKFFYAG